MHIGLITTANRARSIRRRGSSSAGTNEPSRRLGMRSSTSPAWVDSSRPRCRCDGGALLAALIGTSADVLGGLGIDQRLEHQGEPFADAVQVTAGAQCIQQLGQGRTG